MNQEAIVLGNRYECRPKEYQRPIIGSVIAKSFDKCTILVESYAAMDHDRISTQEHQITTCYSEIFGPAPATCFFS